MIKHNIVYNPVIDWRFDLGKAEGSYLWDKDGKKYIDFSSGWNTTNLGWNNPEVNEALRDLKRQGKIKSIGVSNTDLAELKEFNQQGDVEYVQIDLV